MEETYKISYEEMLKKFLKKAEDSKHLSWNYSERTGNCPNNWREYKAKNDLEIYRVTLMTASKKFAKIIFRFNYFRPRGGEIKALSTKYNCDIDLLVEDIIARNGTKSLIDYTIAKGKIDFEFWYSSFCRIYKKAICVPADENYEKGDKVRMASELL